MKPAGSSNRHAFSFLVIIGLDALDLAAEHV